MKASILQRGARMGALALALGLALVPAPLPTPASAAAAAEAQGLDVRTSSDLRSMKAQMVIDRLTVDNMTVEACDARVHWAPGGISHELFASDWSNIQDSAHIGSLSATGAGTDNGYRRQYGSANRYSVASVPGASTLANPFAPGNVYTLFNNHETGDGQGGTQSRGFKRGGFILDATIAGMGGGTFTGADGGPLLKLKFADAGRRVVNDTIETFDIQVEVKSITLNDVVRLEDGAASTLVAPTICSFWVDTNDRYWDEAAGTWRNAPEKLEFGQSNTLAQLTLEGGVSKPGAYHEGFNAYPRQQYTDIQITPIDKEGKAIEEENLLTVLDIDQSLGSANREAVQLLDGRIVDDAVIVGSNSALNDADASTEAYDGNTDPAGLPDAFKQVDGAGDAVARHRLFYAPTDIDDGTDEDDAFALAAYTKGSFALRYYGNVHATGAIVGGGWKTVQLDFDLNGHGKAVPSQLLVEGNVPHEAGAPTADGLSFAGWYHDDGVFQNPWDASRPLFDDTTVHAKWTAALTTHANGGSEVAGQVKTDGDVWEAVPDSAWEDHAFAGWYASPVFEADTRWDNGARNAVTGNVDLYAKWTPYYRLVTHENGGSEVPDQKVLEGSAWAPVEAPAREGYVFDGWYAAPDCAEDGKWDGSSAHTATADVDLYAKWERARYTVTVPTAIAYTGQAVGKVDTTDAYDVHVEGRLSRDDAQLVVGVAQGSKVLDGPTDGASLICARACCTDEDRASGDDASAMRLASAEVTAAGIDVPWKVTISGNARVAAAWTGTVDYVCEER